MITPSEDFSNQSINQQSINALTPLHLFLSSCFLSLVSLFLSLLPLQVCLSVCLSVSPSISLPLSQPWEAFFLVPDPTTPHRGQGRNGKTERDRGQRPG